LGTGGSGESLRERKDVDPQREEIDTIVCSKKMRNIGAVILAAGESSRLGQPKQLVQFRGQSSLAKGRGEPRTSSHAS
jgi:hypothetical protein